jgi:hypothetical protein
MPLQYLHSSKYLHNSTHQYINMNYIIEILSLIEMATRADLETCGRPLEPIFFTLFHPRIGPADVSKGVCPICG